MLAVISPAKTFGQGERATDEHTQPKFLKETAKLISQLKRMSATDLSKLMHVSGNIAKLNVERYKNWKKKPSIGCLLYTSPSPRDRTRSRMPSSA